MPWGPTRRGLPHACIQLADHAEAFEDRLTAWFPQERSGGEGREVAPEARVPCAEGINFPTFLQAVPCLAGVDRFTQDRGIEFLKECG